LSTVVRLWYERDEGGGLGEEELVIACKFVLHGGHLRNREGQPEIELVLETMERQGARCQLSFEIGCHFYLSVLSGGDIQGFDHPAGRRIRVSSVFHLVPEFTPIHIRQQVLLPLAIQECSGLVTQAFDHMAVVDTAGAPNGGAAMHMNAS
jgi:hypothetical protein